MKKKSLVYQSAITIVFFMFYTSIKAYAIDYTISFAGSGASTLVESVLVQNITKGSTIIVPSGNSLQLTDAPNAIEQLNANDEAIKIYSNLEEGKSTMSFYAKQAGKTQINAYSIDGQRAASLNTNLQEGKNSFQLSFAKGTYVLQVIGNGYSYTAKLISQSKSDNKTEIIYLETGKTNSNAPKKSKSSVTTMFYSSGDRLIYKGSSGNLTTIVADVPTNSKSIDFYFFECKDVDGNYYPIVKIGSQIWMAENLKTSKYRNNVAITDKTNLSSWEFLSSEAYSNYNSESHTAYYGKLYNWYAIKNHNGLAPLGWHISTDDDWMSLTNFLGGTNSAGNKLKESTSLHWISNNTATTNETGFTALPGGIRQTDDLMSLIGIQGFWWTSSEGYDINYAWCRSLYSQFISISRQNQQKFLGLSVRCVKGDIQTLTTSTLSDISTTSAIGGGFINNDGNKPITERGVCWSTTPNPTILNNKTVDGSGIGAFTSTITGLSQATKYYIKAYATNIEGTVYGNELIFTTLSLYADGFYITGGASAYPTIEIAGQFKTTPLENDNFSYRSGLVEKYVALESGKSFTITEVSGPNINAYGPGDGFGSVVQVAGYDEMGATIQKGKYASGGTFTVPNSGLYHVVIDKQTTTVVIMPVSKWAILGAATPLGWSDNDMLAKGTFSKDTMVYEINDITLLAGDFKFRHSGAWKQTVVTSPLIKVCTHLGGTSITTLVPGGMNIPLVKAENGKYTVTATWGKTTGLKFSMTKTGVAYPNPNTLVYSLIGDAFNSASGIPAAWDYDLDLIYNESLSTIIDQTASTVIYIYKASNVKLLASGIFKIRKNHLWETNYGYVAANIKGDTTNFVDDGGNIKVITTTTYSSIEFALTLPDETWQLKFTK